ncbi:MAG: response regulator [Anaerolineae bacterium]|jgi:pilus assembly protein CpaE|nr:response regulator [Anaerolineae bacterium]MBT7072399.1 response regulator [Anaerolineae bacterium]MBT7326686.1 response regulator [Anaerolineae bacterium]
MTKILAIDDEKIYHNLIVHALTPQGYQIETASNGSEGIEKARLFKPDLIITDVMMPDMNGYEVTSALRREEGFAHIPVLVLTAQSAMQAKLEAFEAGADDYLTKPFIPQELIARIEALLRRAERTQKIYQESKPEKDKARLIAIHSLRGGTGCSSLSVNLALGLVEIWQSPTILLDLAMTAGQVALMLNAPLKRTWADLARFSAGNIDIEAINSVINQHESGLSFIPAPTLPSEAASLGKETLNTTLAMLRQDFSYIIADLPHDFNEMTLNVLDEADLILLLVAPEMASIRAAVAALDTYAKLGYPPEKINLVLNAVMPRSGLSKEKIESALSLPITVSFPYLADKFVHAINYGQPLVSNLPDEPITALFEDFAFHLSQNKHKKTKPALPA